MKLKVKILLYVAITVFAGMAVLFTVNFFMLQNNMFKAEVAKARSFVLAAEGVREFMGLASAADIYKTDELEHDINRLLLTVPIVGSMKAMELKSEEAGLKFKVPKISPRNPVNEPDATDLIALKELDKLDTGKGSGPEYVFHDKENKQLRYYKAIRLTQVCLKCHGDPATSQALWGNSEGLDPTGVRMENWKAGELHGAFEVFLPTEPVYAAIYKNLFVSFLVFLPVTIMILIIL
jgi:methyl-accepting chemotaxis protein